MKTVFPLRSHGKLEQELSSSTEQSLRCPDLFDMGHSTGSVRNTEATFAYKGVLCRKPRINFPKAHRQVLPKKGKIQLLHIRANQNS